MTTDAGTHGSYQACSRCVMDTSDPEIAFDGAGVCSHCQRYDRLFRLVVARANSGQREGELLALVEKIKHAGRRKTYDCIVGVSGGVDSTYVLLQAKKLGLRPLAVHFDSGWNSELAVNNIENATKKLDVDLFTDVVNWNEMRDLQLAFFRASVANCDTPTDHAFPAVALRQAARYRVGYILTGSNFATEGVLPPAWGYNSADARQLKAIHKQFGSVPLTSYPTLGIVKKDFWYPYVRGVQSVRFLNYMPYLKKPAKKVIQDELGWRDYGGKHHESIFTRFFQGYYLPVKFGYDKRLAHYSSLINSDQLTRDDALVLLQEDTYDPLLQQQDKVFIAKKLGVSDSEFDELLRLPNKHYSDYPSNARAYQLAFSLRRRLRGGPRSDAGAT